MRPGASDIESEIELLASDSLTELDNVVIVDHSRAYPGNLVFEPFDNDHRQLFFERYGIEDNWVSRYLVLNEHHMFSHFIDLLVEDGWIPVFAPSTKYILDAYERWGAELKIEGFTCPNGKDLRPYQTFALQRALERNKAGKAGDRLMVPGWCAGAGKMSPVSEPVLTPSGWATIGDLRPGDYVIGSDGRATRVVSVHPQGVQPVYRLEMNDGTFVRCGAEHLWNVRKWSTRRRGPSASSPSRKERIEEMPWKTLTTAEIAATIDRGRRWQLPLLSPVTFSADVNLPLDPYVLGVFLGDGSWANKSATITTDDWIVDQFGWPIYKSKFDGHPYCRTAGIPRFTRDLLRGLGLESLRSWEKFVPAQYLTAAIDDRLALLQGLLDTDGSPDPRKSTVEYSTTSPDLRDAVADLVRGLGGKATVSAGRVTSYTNEKTDERIPGRESWRVHISMTMPPFRLPRKLDRWRPPTQYEPVKTIVDVVDEGVSEEQVCIVVEAADNLYVTRGHTLTHNSLFACAGAQELVNRGEIDLALAFTMQRHKKNLCRFFDDTTELKAVVMEGTKSKRRKLYADESHDVYVLNYAQPRFDFDELREITVGRRVLFAFDEVQQILTAGAKNQARKALDELIKGCHATVWPMTASIVGSNPLRYRSVFGLSQAQKNPLGSAEDFENRYLERDQFDRPKKRTYERRTAAGGTFYITDYDWDLAALHEIRHRVSDRVHNARKGDPGIREYFPPLEVKWERIQLSDEDRKLVDAVEFLKGHAKRAGESLAPYALVSRYIHNTPEALRFSDSQVAKVLCEEFPELITSKNSAKLEYFLDQVESIADAGDKVIVFTKWTNLGLQVLSRELDGRKIRHVVHHGAQSEKESQKAQDTFKADPSITVFLSSDAGAYCLNMQEARYCIQYECPYSYDDFQQRINRIHRSDSELAGLTAYIYVTEDSIEERIAGVCEARRQLAEATLGTNEVVALPDYATRDEEGNAEWLLEGAYPKFWEMIEEHPREETNA